MNHALVKNDLLAMSNIIIVKYITRICNKLISLNLDFSELSIN